MVEVSHLKNDAKVMLTNNINLEDHIMNGEAVTKQEFKYDNHGNVTTMYV